MIRIASTLLAMVLAVAVPSVAAGQRANTLAPMDFELHALDGSTRRLSDYRGKWVVVNYWATWCPPCLDEIPELDSFHERYHEKLAVVLGINFERIGLEELKDFLDTHLVDYPVFRASPGRSTPFGPLRGLPATYIIDPQGVPVAKQEGGVTAELLEAFILNYTTPE